MSELEESVGESWSEKMTREMCSESVGTSKAGMICKDLACRIRARRMEGEQCKSKV